MMNAVYARQMQMRVAAQTSNALRKFVYRLLSFVWETSITTMTVHRFL